MGHSDQKNLLSAFEQVANDNQTTVANFLDNPSLLDLATQRFIPSLNRLRTSWTKKEQRDSKTSRWEYATAVKDAYNLIRSDYGNEQDRSGALMFYHPMAVADNSFRMCKLFGFDDKEATTIWIAALCHDYLERARTEGDFKSRLKKMKNIFNTHDPDVTNLVVMLTNREKSRPYFKYVEQIGCKNGFTAQSTHKAQLGVCIIKDSDSSHNTDPSRNLYLDRDQAMAEMLARSGNPADHQRSRELLVKVERTRTKVQMYPIARALMRAKIKGLLNVSGGVSMETQMVDFLLSDKGSLFNVDAYAAARTAGLGPEENDRYTKLITQQREQEHKVIAFQPPKDSHTKQEPPLTGSFLPASSSIPPGKNAPNRPPSIAEIIKVALLLGHTG